MVPSIKSVGLMKRLSGSIQRDFDSAIDNKQVHCSWLPVSSCLTESSRAAFPILQQTVRHNRGQLEEMNPLSVTSPWLYCTHT